MAELNTLSLLSDANLIAYYRFNTGALTTDSKGSNTLTNNNTVGETASGKYGYAADFGTSNTDKYFSRASDLGITGGAISMAAWIKVRTEPGDATGQAIVYQSDSGNDVAFDITYKQTSSVPKITCTRSRDGIGADAVSHDVTLGTTLWHHVALTYNGTTMRLYLNGTDVGNTAASGNGSDPVTTDSFNIGRYGYDTGSNYASMYIDDVAVFNRALTAEEVLSLYSETSLLRDICGYFEV